MWDTHIDRLFRGLTYGLQVIEGLHRAGVRQIQTPTHRNYLGENPPEWE